MRREQLAKIHNHHRQYGPDGATRPNLNKKRKYGGVRVNFIAQFDIDESETDLTLQPAEYDPSADADINAWLLLEPVGEAAEAAAEPMAEM